MKRGGRYDEATVAAVKIDFEAGAPYAVMASTHGVSETTIWLWAKERGWDASRRARGRPPRRSLADALAAADRNRREAERLRYGALEDDVRILRRRGWIVVLTPYGFDVGHRVLDADGLRALAARERRLARRAA